MSTKVDYWVLMEVKGANAMLLEKDKFLVCAWCYGKDCRPPTNERAFLSHLKGLAVPDFYELVERSEPISRISEWKGVISGSGTMTRWLNFRGGCSF